MIMIVCVYTFYSGTVDQWCTWDGLRVKTLFVYLKMEMYYCMISMEAFKKQQVWAR